MEPERLHHLAPRQRTLARERDDALDELGRRLRCATDPAESAGLPNRSVEVRQVPSRDRVDRRPHQERAHDATAQESPVESPALEAFDP